MSSFSIDTSGYREAELSDLPSIVKIHQIAFPGFFMTLLGPRFLEGYYRLVIAYPGKVFWVKEGEAGLEGFVSGFLSPGSFYTNMRVHRWSLIGSILLQICTRPWLLPRLFASYAQAQRSSHDEEVGACELSSIAVPPHLGGRGVGKGLVHAFVGAIRGKAKFIELTTDAGGNDAANGFYRSLGFTLVGSYERSRGRCMNKYRLPLDA